MNGTLMDFYPFLQPLLGWLAVISLGTFLLSLILIPWGVGRLKPDCFLRLYDSGQKTAAPTAFSILLLVFRNLLGLFLVLAGAVMLFLPGQGLLTILLGVLLLSFPGKHKLINGLVRQPKIQHSLDWLRRKRGKTPFLWP